MEECKDGYIKSIFSTTLHLVYPYKALNGF